MGLDLNGVRFLLYAQRLGADFDESAMIGRQSLDLTKSELRTLFDAFGKIITDQGIDYIFHQGNGYAEPLLATLGAKSIHSFDFSDYEAATHLWDMNHPIPSEFVERYSLVLDGGSLEHIFNFPIALRNCMEMLRIGGYFLSITPANNFMGHGFYQFSPEMFFSVFTPKNGFRLLNLIAFEDRPAASWYSIRNPGETGGRILLVNDCPVYLLVIAERFMKTSIFASSLQQSDYVATWEQQATELDSESFTVSRQTKQISFRNWLKRHLPFRLRHLIQVSIPGYGFNPRYFKAMDPTQAGNLPQESPHIR